MSIEEKIVEKKSFYEKYHKPLTFVYLTFLVLSLLYIIFYFSVNKEPFKRDISLSGGTVITIYGDYDESKIKETISKYTNSYKIKTTQDIYTHRVVSKIIEAKLEEEKAKKFIDELGISSYSIEVTSPELGVGFFRQLIIAIGIAFIFMAIVVFIIFRTFVPSIAIILAALTDIIGTLAILNILNIEIGAAGIAAFLMLIGYSVDTDIMLTTKVIRARELALVDRLKSSLKTGLTMTLTSLIAIFIAFLFTNSLVLKQIFMILCIGLSMDIFSTWIGNISIITWYVKKKYKE
jgi:preprotein translocase subunit SecF